MKKNLKNLCMLIMIAVTVCLFASVTPKAQAAEVGTLVSNPIILEEGIYHTKWWRHNNYDLNCYNKIVVPSRGYITISIIKPYDDEGEIGYFDIDLFTPDGVLAWSTDTEEQIDTFSDSYVYKVGVAAGTYYMNLKSSFYVYSDSAPIDTTYKYDFTATDTWEIEPNNTQAVATQIELNKMYNGVYTEESYDTVYQDFYAVKLVEGRNYKINVDNFKQLDAGTLILNLVDPSGESTYLDDYDAKESGTLSYWEITAAETGTYFIQFDNDSNEAGTEYKVGVYDNSISASKFSAVLSATSYTYDGKVKSPSVTVKDTKGNTLTKDVDYSVNYESGRKLPGTYTVTITFKGKYSGSKTLTFKIAPKATGSISAVTSTSAIKLTWKKVTGADGYRIYQYNTKTKKWEKIKTITSGSTVSYKVKELKAGTKYKFRVKAYTKDDGTIWGKNSATFETATKCKTPSIKVTSTAKGKAVVAWSNVAGESGYQVYYSTKKDGEYKKVKNYSANTVKGSKSKLKSGKKYYFKVRAYTKTSSGVVYSAWSSVKSVKVK